MPTIYLRDRVFSKIVNSGHYNDYERVLERGVDLFLMEERANMSPSQVLGMAPSDLRAAELERDEDLERRQIPKSSPGPMPSQPEEYPGSTFTGPETVATVTDPICPKCHKPVLENDHYGLAKNAKYHLACLQR